MTARRSPDVGSGLNAVNTATLTAATDKVTPEVGPSPLDYALAGWPVFPLNGKHPAIRSAHPLGDPLRGRCHGECGRLGHGVYDGTTDPERAAEMFAGRPSANVGARVPDGLIVVDVDPRHDGHLALEALEAKHAPLPETLTARSGRGDGGTHRYYLAPGGTTTATRFGRTGIDLKFGGRGYTVLPPSLHPDTGRPYEWLNDLAPVALPTWFVALLRPERPKVQRRAARPTPAHGDSPADWFREAHTWTDVLQGYAPAPWQLVAGDGESDGSGWRHPAATSKVSATVLHGLLFVYSPNTLLPVTEPGNPHGLTKFRAWALLTERTLPEAAREAVRMRERLVFA